MKNLAFQGVVISSIYCSSYIADIWRMWLQVAWTMRWNRWGKMKLWSSAWSVEGTKAYFPQIVMYNQTRDWLMTDVFKAEPLFRTKT